MMLSGVVSNEDLNRRTRAALEKITKSTINQLFVTNTLPQEEHAEGCEKLKVLDISHVLAETIRRSHYGESVSYLFDAMLWDPIRIDCMCPRLEPRSFADT